MRALQRFGLSFLSSALFGASVSAQNGSRLQADVTFPRNNTAYQHVWPFPIVIAYHNEADSLPPFISLEWSLRRLGIYTHPRRRTWIEATMTTGPSMPIILVRKQE